MNPTFPFCPGGANDLVARPVDADLKSSELRARLMPQGINPVGGTRADFTQFIAAEKPGWGRSSNRRT